MAAASRVAAAQAAQAAAETAAAQTASQLQQISAQLNRLQHLAAWTPSGAWSACCLFGSYSVDVAGSQS